MSMAHTDRLRYLGAFGDLPDKRDNPFPAGVIRATLDVASPVEAWLEPVLLPEINDQGRMGSCVGQSVRAMLMIEAAEDGVAADLSAMALWYYGRLAINAAGSNTGCHARDVLNTARVRGVPLAVLHPYEERLLATSPSKAAEANALNHKVTEYYAVRDIADAKIALVNGNPVTFAFMVASNFTEAATTGVTPPYNNRPAGAHQVVAVGYSDRITFKDYGVPGGFLCMNWWGDRWGIRHPNGTRPGCFWMPYGYASDPDLCFSWWTVHGVPLYL